MGKAALLSFLAWAKAHIHMGRWEGGGGRLAYELRLGSRSYITAAFSRAFRQESPANSTIEDYDSLIRTPVARFRRYPPRSIMFAMYKDKKDGRSRLKVLHKAGGGGGYGISFVCAFLHWRMGGSFTKTRGMGRTQRAHTIYGFGRWACSDKQKKTDRHLDVPSPIRVSAKETSVLFSIHISILIQYIIPNSQLDLANPCSPENPICGNHGMLGGCHSPSSTDAQSLVYLVATAPRDTRLNKTRPPASLGGGPSGHPLGLRALASYHPNGKQGCRCNVARAIIQGLGGTGGESRGLPITS